MPVIGRAVRPVPPALDLGAAPGWPRRADVARHRIRFNAGAHRCPFPAVAAADSSIARPCGARSARPSRPVEGLLAPGEAVGGPVHPDHRRRRSVAGQPQQLARLPAGDRAEHVRPVRQRREHRRRPVRPGRPRRRARSAPSRQEKTYSKPSPHQRPSTDAVRSAAPARRASTARCRPGRARPRGEQLVRQVDDRRAVPDEPSTAAPDRAGRAVAAAPAVRAGQEAGHRAVVPDVHHPVAPLRHQDQPEPEARRPRASRR